VIDTDGHEWLTVVAAAAAVNVRPNTVRVWITRGKVRSVKVDRTRFVALLDVQRAERAWRRRDGPNG
jgi:hypothetical protein